MASVLRFNRPLARSLIQLLQYCLCSSLELFPRDSMEVRLHSLYAPVNTPPHLPVLIFFFQMSRPLYMGLLPLWVFYTSLGVPPEEPLPELALVEEDDTEFVDITWAESAVIGQTVDYFSTEAEKWVPATIVQLSPTCTEAQLSVNGVVGACRAQPGLYLSLFCWHLLLDNLL